MDISYQWMNLKRAAYRMTRFIACCPTRQPGIVIFS